MSWPGNYAGASDTTLITGDDGEPTNCPRCSGKVNLSDYYGSVFWGFFEPPTCLKTGAEKKNSKRTIVKHYCVYYLFFCISLYLCKPVSADKIDIDII